MRFTAFSSPQNSHRISPVAIGELAGKRGDDKPLPPFQEKCGYIIFILVTVALILQQQLSSLLTAAIGIPLETWQICFIGALLMVLTGVLTPRQATDALPVWMYLLLVGSLTMGGALQQTGAGDAIGNALAGVVGNLSNQYLIGFSSSLYHLF